MAEPLRVERDCRELLLREQAARAEAELANQAKDQFLARLSHELRTPLTSILGWVRMLRSGQLSDAQAARALEVIERSAQMQIRLIEDLLDVSRIVAGEVALDVRPVDLADEVRTTVEALRPSARANGVEVQVTLDPAVGAIRGDPDRCRQIIANLVSNAVRYTPAGGRVEVRLERADAGRARVVVADTGVGISPAFLPHVFERFTRARQSSSRTDTGLGLGLSITRHLVALHGGTIRVESLGEGHGATFIVELPPADHGSTRAAAGSREGPG